MKGIFQDISIFVFLLVFSLNTTYASKHGLDSDEAYSYNYAKINNKCAVYDPYENINRKIFYFNGALDMFITKPIAKVYEGVTNKYIRDRVGGFVDNFDAPTTTISYALQGNQDGFLKSFWRFVINSTLGIGGMFDVAAKFGLKVESQDFGHVLGHYGVGSGPYIVLPFIGGTSGRDFLGPLYFNSVLNPLKHYVQGSFKTGLFVTKIIHVRHVVMPFTDYVTKNASDPYIMVRDAIMHQRESKIYYPDGFVCPSVK